MVDILQLLLFLVLLFLITVLGLVNILISTYATVLFAQAIDELEKSIESSLTTIVNDLIGAFREQLNSWEALNLDIFEFVES